MPVPSLRLCVLGLLCLVSVLPGCKPLARDALVIATSWPTADRRRFEEEFAGWLERHPDASVHGPIRIDWLVLAPGDDFEGLGARRHPPDVLLGGPARSYVRLAGAKRLTPLPIDGSPDWAVARRAAIRLVSRSSEGGGTSTVENHGGVAFDDPRNDPISLAWAEAQLVNGGFGEGYARLVRAATARRRIGRQSGSAAAAVERGETDLAVGIVPADQDSPGSGAIPWPEGVAILAGGGHREQAMRFLRFLAETGRAESPTTGPGRASSDVLDLLAELLGSTVVDAQDELWAAWAVLERAGSPPGPLRSMSEPPPWPPASIAKILRRQGEQAMAMVETLAGQLATDPGARAWLISSWLSPPRLMDRRVLEELTRAADGRLSREPRFREWLRAEWTAWARQRYRRVLRALEAEGGPMTPSTSPIH